MRNTAAMATNRPSVRLAASMRLRYD
jgi:hypothetical protein